MDTLLQDVRYAWRSLRRSSGFTAVAVLALALGIGANTAIFSVVNGVLLRPLPYAEPERVVMIWNHWEGWPATWLSEPEVADYRALSRSLERVAAFTTGGRNLTGGDAPERVRAGFVTADVFPVLGVGAARGRVFGAEEDRPGGARVAVLSHGLWQRRFGGDPGVIGRTIQLNDSSVTVLGVMPEGFQLPLDLGGQPMDLWLPLQLDTPDPNNRGSHYLYGIGRLKPGVSLDAAQRDFGAAVRRMLEANPDSYSPAFGATLVPVREQ